MRRRSGSVGGPSFSPDEESGDPPLASVSSESLAHIAGTDYSDEAIFDEIHEDVMDAIKKWGDRYDIRQEMRSFESAMFVLSSDSLNIHTQLIDHFANRPEFSVKTEVFSDVSDSGGEEETVVIYRKAKPAPTTGEKIKKKMPYIVGSIVCFCYLYYIGTV